MTMYHYTAIDRDGRSITGQLEADSREAVLRRLTQDGHFPVDAVAGEAGAVGTSGSFLASLRAPRSAEITLFTRELSMLLRAGVTLTHAMSLIESEGGAPRIQRLAGRLRRAISGGSALSDALAAEGDTFPPVYQGMIKAAEATGSLEDVLEQIAETREREQKLKSKITSALLYPCLLIATAIGAVVLLMILVVPRFKEMLADQAGRLPPSTAAIIAVSDWMVAWGEVLALTLAGALVLALVVGRQPWARRIWERMAMATPGLGRLVSMGLTVRFCRTMGVLLGAGVGLPSALALTRDVIGHEGARDLIDQLRKALREGGEFAEILARSRLFPTLVGSMMKVGSESGKLSGSALHLAEMYESKLEIAMQRLVTILEPLIIIFVSVLVAFVVLSIVGAIVGVYDLTAGGPTG